MGWASAVHLPSPFSHISSCRLIVCPISITHTCTSYRRERLLLNRLERLFIWTTRGSISLGWFLMGFLWRNGRKTRNKEKRNNKTRINLPFGFWSKAGSVQGGHSRPPPPHLSSYISHNSLFRHQPVDGVLRCFSSLTFSSCNDIWEPFLFWSSWSGVSGWVIGLQC